VLYIAGRLFVSFIQCDVHLGFGRSCETVTVRTSARLLGHSELVYTWLWWIETRETIIYLCVVYTWHHGNALPVIAQRDLD
jgi:hypothetical protein